MGIEKTLMLAHESIYCIHMNANIEAIKSCLTCLDHQATEPWDNVMSQKIPGRLWESVRADIFTINNKHYLCTQDDHTKFHVRKQVEGFCADNLIKTCKIIFSKIWAAQQDSFRCRHKPYCRSRHKPYLVQELLQASAFKMQYHWHTTHQSNM